jgi:hypothetical protein
MLIIVFKNQTPGGTGPVPAGFVKEENVTFIIFSEIRSR